MGGTRDNTGVKTTGHGAAALAACATVVFLAAFACNSATAAVGVEAVSRRGGEPGDEVTVTLSCGFCFPPCKGPKGERHPEGFAHGPCMIGTKAGPPHSFGVSLVPRSEAPAPRPCGPRSVCSPHSPAPPRHPPYAFLGLAVPPPGGNNPEHGDPPRYLLRFAIPDLPPGDYVYVIWCDACLRGASGSLVTSPRSRLWQLHIRQAATATAGRRY